MATAPEMQLICSKTEHVAHFRIFEDVAVGSVTPLRQIALSPVCFEPRSSGR